MEHKMGRDVFTLDDIKKFYGEQVVRLLKEGKTLNFPSLELYHNDFIDYKNNKVTRLKVSTKWIFKDELNFRGASITIFEKSLDYDPARPVGSLFGMDEPDGKIERTRTFYPLKYGIHEFRNEYVYTDSLDFFNEMLAKKAARLESRPTNVYKFKPKSKKIMNLIHKVPGFKTVKFSDIDTLEHRQTDIGAQYSCNFKNQKRKKKLTFVTFGN